DQEAQIKYLKQIEALNPDAIILVSNRFASQEESDDVLLKNLDTVTRALKPTTCLGIYECPYPYKRLLSERVIKRIAQDCRFKFTKDTCCDDALIEKRIAWMRGSALKLFNANGAMLMQSLKSGAAGFSGVYLNVVPELFSLFRDQFTHPIDHAIIYRSLAVRIADYLAQFSLMECQNYPANAKYWLKESKIIKTDVTRNGKPSLTRSQKLEIDALKKEYWLTYMSWQRKPAFEFLFKDGESFKSCHASTVLPLDHGDVLAAYFAGTREGADDVAIYLSAKRKGAWEAPRLIAKLSQTPHWNPVLFMTCEGVRIVFKTGKKIESWKSFTMLSTNEGRTWSDAVPVDTENTAGGPVRSKPIAYCGALLAPNSDECGGVWEPRVDRSTDNGKTFQRFANIPVNLSRPEEENFISGRGAIQPTLFETSDGNAHAFLRTTAGKLFRSDSKDGGKTWCEAYETGLLNNNSGIDAIADGKNIYLICNPTSTPMGLRTPLVIWRSGDSGKTYQLFKTLQNTFYDPCEDQPAEFSYPAMALKDGALHVTYTYMRRQIVYSKISIKKE
ncbi:MAG: exo-alpha-sialidase, partial [Clostridia bacterium]